MSSNKKKFFAEVTGTFILVVVAAGPSVLDAKYPGAFGPWFSAICQTVGIGLAIHAFSKTSLAHFNPAITIGFLITRHVSKNLLGLYFGAELIGAFLGAFFVKHLIGTQAHIGANAPNYSFPIILIFIVEVTATVFLMGITLIVIHQKGHHGEGPGWAKVGTVIGLDIFFFSSISGASMNPARSLAPALLSGYVNDLWLYLTAPFVGTIIVALIYRKKFAKKII
jgi:aquaporin Z